jgi:methyltransferase-like protein 6
MALRYYEFTEEQKASASAVIEADSLALPVFQYSKFETQAQKMWDLFYKHNTTHFYKDRHYLTREFPELLHATVIREAGCGVGNAVFPLLVDCPGARIQACDFSPRAIELMRSSDKYDRSRIESVVWDISAAPVEFGPCDAVMLMFVLSAISPEKQADAVRNATANLEIGGLVCVRDYALYDMAQLRLAEKKRCKLGENFYLKTDGTRVYYFSQESLRGLFSNFEEEQNELHYRLIENRKEAKTMHRVWIQAKYRRVS